MNIKPGSVEVLDISDVDMKLLDSLLLNEHGRVRCYEADYYRTLNPVHLRVLANQRARYQIVTRELVDWLKEQIGDQKAIEIGAGCGDLGHYLGITMTDSYQQATDPATQEYMALFKQKGTTPPPDVIMEHAETAVRKRKPDVVIACWMTQKYLDSDPAGEGNYLGPREDYILERCRKYIMVGNENIHGKKRLLKKPHLVLRFPWLVSRARDQSKNVIYVWENPNPIR